MVGKSLSSASRGHVRCYSGFTGNLRIWFGRGIAAMCGIMPVKESAISRIGSDFTSANSYGRSEYRDLNMPLSDKICTRPAVFRFRWWWDGWQPRIVKITSPNFPFYFDPLLSSPVFVFFKTWSKMFPNGPTLDRFSWAMAEKPFPTSSHFLNWSSAKLLWAR